MGTIRYTSDLHLNHPFVAKLRGFTRIDGYDDEGNVIIKGDAEAHDGVIIENFNKGTRNDDITIIAGDFAMNWKGVETKLAQLRGTRILIEGNHDIMSSIHRNGWKHRAEWTGDGRFTAIMAFMRRKVGDREFLISHYPYAGDHTPEDRLTQYRLRDEGLWLVHGHTHAENRLGENITYGKIISPEGRRWHPSRRQVHVGLDAWDLKPVPERDVMELMSAEEQRALDSLARW